MQIINASNGPTAGGSVVIAAAGQHGKRRKGQEKVRIPTHLPTTYLKGETTKLDVDKVGKTIMIKSYIHIRVKG
jgi:hypothetical protein